MGLRLLHEGYKVCVFHMKACGSASFIIQLTTKAMSSLIAGDADSKVYVVGLGFDIWGSLPGGEKLYSLQRG